MAALLHQRRQRQRLRKERKETLRAVKRHYLQSWHAFCFSKPSKRVVSVREHYSATFARRGLTVRRLTKLFQYRPGRFMQETAVQLHLARLLRKYIALLLAHVGRMKADRRHLRAVEEERRLLRGIRTLFRNTLQLANSREYTKIGAMYCSERAVRCLLRLWRVRAKVLRAMRARRALAQRFAVARMMVAGVFALKKDVLFERDIRREKKLLFSKKTKSIVSN